MAAGDFTASTLYNVQRRMSDMFGGQRQNAHLNLPSPTLIAALTKQTARFDPIQTQTRQTRGVEVSFLKRTITVNDAADTPVTSCTIGGAEGESDKITMTPTEDLWTEFSVIDQDVNDIYSFEEKVADGFARSMVNLRLAWNNKLLAWFNSNIATTPTIRTGDGTLNGNVIEVAKATMNTAEYIATMAAIAAENDMYSPFIISGRIFWVPKYAAQFKSAACCSLDAIFDGPFEIFFDIKNIDSIVGTDSVLMIDPAAYAIWPHNHIQSDTPVREAADTLVWRQPDPILQFADGGILKPVYYDVIAQRKCVINQADTPDAERWGTNFRIHMRWGKSLAPNPSGLGTGIIEWQAT